VGVNLRLLGIPCRIDPSALVVLAVMATSARTSSGLLVAFVLGAVVAVVAHELGHALVARAFGASDISISVVAYGGVTRYRPTSSSRWQQSMISAAGPAVGLGLGVIVWAARAAASPVAHSPAAAVYAELLFVTAGWSLVNLLPVLPLDGGRLLEQALPGSAQDRSRFAGLISAVVAAIAADWFWRHNANYPALMFALLAIFGGYTAISGIATGSQHRHSASCDAFRLVAACKYADAEALTRAARTVDPALLALIAAVHRGDQNASNRLWRLYDTKSDDAMVRSCVVLWRAHISDWPGVLSMLQQGAVKAGACRAALLKAFEAEAFHEGAGIGEATLRVSRDPLIAYTTARCWARSGNPQLALRALMRAIDYGWTHWALVDADPNLDSVRADPGFLAWRQTFPASGAAVA
jgi:Zn-dependent protease